MFNEVIKRDEQLRVILENCDDSKQFMKPNHEMHFDKCRRFLSYYEETGDIYFEIMAATRFSLGKTKKFYSRKVYDKAGTVKYWEHAEYGENDLIGRYENWFPSETETYKTAITKNDPEHIAEIWTIDGEIRILDMEQTMDKIGPIMMITKKSDKIIHDMINSGMKFDSGYEVMDEADKVIDWVLNME